MNDKVQSLTNENDTLKQENNTFLKIVELMQRGTNKEELSVPEESKGIPGKTVRIKTIRKSVKLMKLIRLHRIINVNVYSNSK